MYKKILHATDLSTNHYNLCQKAVLIAGYYQAEIHLVHVIELPSSFQLAQGLGFTQLVTPVKNDAEIVMKLLAENFNVPSTHLHIQIGSIKSNIIQAIKDLDIDLLIIGSHTSNTLPVILGSNAQTLTQHAPCDVLTIRNDLEAA